MNYTFPMPKEVPYVVKQRVMNHVFPKQERLLKRASFVRIFSASLMFVGIFVLFSVLYLRPSSYQNQPLNNQTSVIVTQVSNPSLLSSSTSSQEIDDVETALVQAEQVLSELDSLI